MNHFLALLVALPLFAAPLIALIQKRHAAWVITFVTLIILLFLSLFISSNMLDHGLLTYDMGNWAPPFGIEYHVDGLNAAILVLISLMAVVIMPFALPQYLKEVPAEKQSLAYAIFVLCVAGLLGMTITHDLFNMYVFLEISSLATYTLISLGNSKRAPVAGFEYLILGSIGATFYLIGLGFLYMATGTLNLTDMSILLQPLADSKLVRAGLGFLVLGLLLKAAVFPLHIWLVQSYTNAPTLFAAFLSATATKVYLYLLMRIIFGMFGVGIALNILPIGPILMVLSAGAVILGSLAAFIQKDVKHMLAYSSIAQIGFIVFGFSLGTSAGLAAALLHLLFHAPAKAGLFLCVANVEKQRGGSTLTHFRNIGNRMPITSAAFVICGLSLIGIPLTAGFLSKWLMLSALMQAGQWPAFILVLSGSLFTVAYIGKVFEVMFYRKEIEVTHPRGDAPWPLLLPLILLSFLCLYFGMFSEDVMLVTRQATNLFFRAGD
jgi:multicomponent Na+:H+ antiporter subunit D